MEIGSLTGSITLDDQFTPALARIDRGLRQVEASTSMTTQAVQHVQSSMTMAATAGAFLGTTLANYAAQALSWGKNLISSSLMAGARLEQLGGVTRFLGERAGYSAQYIDELAEKIEKSGITGVQSRDAITQLISAHIDLKKATELSSVAQNMATISGESSTVTYGKIIRGITMLQPELLRTAGFTVSLDQVMSKYHETTGKSANALTGQQKQQLLLNAVLEEGAEKAGLYGLSMEYSSKIAGSSERAWEQVSEQIGTVFLPLTNVAIKAWYHMGESIRDFVRDAGGNVKVAMQAIADSFQIVITKAGEFASASVKVGVEVYRAYESIPQVFRFIGRDALIAAAGIFALNVAVTTLTRTQLAVWALTGARALGELGGMTRAFGWEGFAVTIGGWAKPLTSAWQGVVALSTKIFMMGGVLGGVLVTIGSAAIAIASLTAVIYAAKLAWDNYWQSVNAGKDANIQQQKDAENLARINKATGQSFTDLGAAMEFVRKRNTELFQGFRPLDDVLKDLHSNSGNTGTQMRDLETTVAGLAKSGALTTPIVNQVAAAIKASGVSASLLGPNLLGVVHASEVMEAAARALLPQLGTMAERIAAISEENKTYLISAHAANTGMKEMAAHTGVASDVISAFLKEQKALGKGASEVAKVTEASVGKTTQLWDEYYGLIDKRGGDTLAGQLDAIDKWYDKEHQSLDKAANLDENYAEHKTALDALYYEKGVTAATDFEAAQAKIRIASLDTIERGYIDYADKNKAITLKSTALEINQIELQRSAALAGLGARTDANKMFYDNSTAQINKFYDHEKDIANKTASTLEERLRKQGVFTKTELVTQAQNFKAAYDGMVLSGKYTTDELVAAWHRYADGARAAGLRVEISWLAVISDLSKALATFPELLIQAFTGGGNVVGAIKAFGVQLLNTFAKDVLAPLQTMISGFMTSLFKKLASNTGASLTASVGANAAAGMVTPGLIGGSAVAGSAAGGAATGMAPLVSFLTNPITIGVAAAVIGGVVLYKKLHHPEWEKLGKDIGNELGVTIPKEMLKAWEADSKKFGRQITSLLHLDEIVKQAGGITTANFSTMAGKLRDTFVFLAQGQITAAQATEVLDKNFTEFVTAGTSQVGVLNKKVSELIMLQEQSGLSSKAITDYKAGQATIVGGGLTTALGVPFAALASYDELNQKQQDIRAKMAKATTSKELEKLQSQLDDVMRDLTKQGPLWDITKIHSQQAASAIASSLIGVIATNMHAGMSFIDAAKGMSGAVESLATQLKITGYSGGAAFDFLKDVVRLADNEIAGPALTSIHGYSQALVGMSNIGLMNQETFSGLTSQISSTASALVAQGFSGKTVMTAMQSDLQSIWELQQEYGYSVDDSTQALINQAVEEGVVGEKHKSTTQQMLDASNRMVDVLEAMATFMGVKLPAAAHIGANGVQTELDKVHAPDLTFHVGYNIDEAPDYSGHGFNPDNTSNMAGGGPVFRKSGTDVQAAMLTPGERILSVSENNAYESRGANPTQTVVINIDGREVARATVPFIPDELRRVGVRV